jgi:hypothetical protein
LLPADIEIPGYPSAIFKRQGNGLFVLAALAASLAPEAQVQSGIYRKVRLEFSGYQLIHEHICMFLTGPITFIFRNEVVQNRRFFSTEISSAFRFSSN